MKDQGSFVGWDFTDIWDIDQGSSYPYMRDNVPDPLPGVDD
jgi:hypothetical protein